ncbi:MAG: hypothetical protein RL266_2594 [Bacteroidota bacterium]|jgi:hypothetical protein
MRTVIFVMGFVLATFAALPMHAIAQKKIPASVKKSFAQKYPDIKEVIWQMVDGNFEGQFKKDAGEFTAIYTVEGNWLETEEKLRLRDLPTEVSSSVKENYGGYTISSAVKVESASTISFHKLELKKGSGVLELRIFSDGKMEVEELETEDDED